MSYQASHRPLNNHTIETNVASHDYLLDEAGEQKLTGSVTERPMTLRKQSKLATSWSVLWKTPSTIVALFLLGLFVPDKICAKSDSK